MESISMQLGSTSAHNIAKVFQVSSGFFRNY